MKKIFEKLRYKIIHKLGGYVFDPKIDQSPIEIKYYEKHFARLSVDWDPYGEFDAKMYEENKEFIQKKLAYKLADKLLEDDLIWFCEFYDFNKKLTKVDASIEVVATGKVAGAALEKEKVTNA